ncbi:TolC family protein [Vibrio sp. JC009]|uniref:TolC family protein n=1 Tax=Vibrio sp. JC009 TaxID=2912314 RepID=UPI0023B0F734|nr:TolC family protein [Vibrio sp. JC009]WED20669.1 TolC family protein [Vibrio sp. JC009]
MRNYKKVACYKFVLTCCGCVLLWGCKSLNKEPQLSSDVNNKPAAEMVAESAEEKPQQTETVESEIAETKAPETQETENLAIELSEPEEAVSEPVLLTPKDGYLLNFDDVFELALSSSKEYHALGKEVDSKTILKDKEEKYYYPTATMNSETTKYYGSPTPDATETQKFILKLNSKLYGSAVKDKIAASQQSLDAGNISLEAQEISIYYTVLKYLTKVELTRQYEKTAEEFRKEIEIYYLKQVNSTNEGVSTQTDAMEAKLSVAEFDDSVYSVVSNIEQYFKKLSEETGIDLGTDENISMDKIGVNYQRLEPYLAMDVPEITPKELIATNSELRKIQKNLKSSLYNAQATRERFTVELTSENYLMTNGDTNSHSWGDTDESYIQLNLELDLFNQGTQADQDSAYKMYEAEKLRFDKQYKQYMDQFRTNLTNYNQQQIKRQKTADQVDILAGLIENQKEEIYTDQVTYKDIVDSIKKLNNAKQTLLEIDLNLFDTLYELETLKSQKLL